MADDPNDWMFAGKMTGPTRAEVVTGYLLDKDTLCPNCAHPLGQHSVDLGCHVGWGPYINGLAQNDGCECPMTLALQHNPPREKDIS